MTYYAAIKWPYKEGPQPNDVANDLQILAMTLLAEWDWSLETVEDIFDAAIDAAHEQALELDAREQAQEPKPEPCGECDGTGHYTTWPHTTCPTCGGSAVEQEQEQKP